MMEKVETKRSPGPLIAW